jgi:predicted extracellular nuclease
MGSGGRIPPGTVIEDDATGSVETSGAFDPSTDGIDFWESMEEMRVQVNDAHAVGPTSDFGSSREIPVVADDAAGASLLTTRGGILLRQTDPNPERIILNDLIPGGPVLPTTVDVGDSFSGATIGVIDYNLANFKLGVTSLGTLVSGNLAQEVTTAPQSDQLSVASFNVENLDPSDPPSKFNDLANEVVDNMLSPDLIAVEEIQDDNGGTNDSVVDASTTFGMLISAISSAGGPTYDFRQIDPVDDQDGGEPGGNIRVGFLFRTDRGLTFVDRPGGDSTTANSVVSAPGGPQLQYSPGRIDPTNSAWNASRKPLAGEFMYGGTRLFVIANHFNSKSGDQPLYGRFQPPTLSSEVQRNQEAQLVHDFVQGILSVDSSANVIVLGELNDYQWSNPLTTLMSGGVLTDLAQSLPEAERYSYVFEGNSQDLDHLLASSSLSGMLDLYDPIHVNAEFAPQVSAHDPLVALFDLGATAPVACEAGYGTPGPDTIVGTPGADHICGRGGNDTIDGAGGNDIIDGGAGNDTIDGGAGNDVMLGKKGSDDLTGGSGADTLKGGYGGDQLHTLDGVDANDAGNGGRGIDSCTGDPGDTFSNCP